ncbi:MAG: helix-turn-helix transcriptional regulator [Eubacteriales bacterium]|nr:helix-turn-helix transcriptional regulator [Eubacteriales bacterium]MDD3350539.1 helix-turn-helix transcriptional regulator [Eubacteriales bacterium]
MRKNSNLSQEELAEKIGVSRQAVSKWERAEASPDTDNLILLAKLYNVSLDELLFTEESIEVKTEEENKKAREPFCEDAIEENQSARFWRAFPYPLIVTLVYLLLGFTFDVWHPAWILYLTIPIYYSYVGHSCNRHHKR